MRVTEGCGVGHHDARIPSLPESPVIGPANAGNPTGKSPALGWEPGVRPEGFDRPFDQIARGVVADEPDEVTGIRIEPADGLDRVNLASRRVGVVADGFEADHGDDLLAALLAA